MTTKISGTDGIDVAQIRAADGDPVAITISEAGVVALPATPNIGAVSLFSAAKSQAQTLSSGNTKITFETEEFDTDNLYNPATNEFKPNVAGYYLVSTVIYLNGNTSSLTILLYKNGSFHKYLSRIASTTVSVQSPCIGGSCLVYMNGTTDTCSIYGSSGSTVSTAAGPEASYFQANLVRAG